MENHHGMSCQHGCVSQAVYIVWACRLIGRGEYTAVLHANATRVRVPLRFPVAKQLDPFGTQFKHRYVQR